MNTRSQITCTQLILFCSEDNLMQIYTMVKDKHRSYNLMTNFGYACGFTRVYYDI